MCLDDANSTPIIIRIIIIRFGQLTLLLNSRIGIFFSVIDHSIPLILSDNKIDSVEVN